MVRIRIVDYIILLVLVDIIPSSLTVDNGTQEVELDSAPKKIDRHKHKKSKKGRSTSSSSGEKHGTTGSREDESLDMSTSGTDSEEEKKLNKPKSSKERRGWRKWHRKCTPCPEDMRLKWRDPSIKWICGGFQRARRSFKSACMMHYRNCQDGTMFVKIHNNRCANKTENEKKPYHGDNFFYEYKVVLSGDSSNSQSETTEEDENSSSVDR